MPRDDNFYAPRHRNARSMLPWILLMVVVVGIAVFAAANIGFGFNRGPVNDPTAAPRPVEPRGELDPEEAESIALFEGAHDSVVNIDTIQRVRNIFDMTVQEQQTGTGSGFIWDDDGRIVTNFHVVRPALPNGGIRVVLADRSIHDAQLVGMAPDYDLAVLKINVPRAKLKPIRVGSSKDLKVGMKTYAIGNPFGLTLTLTKGIVSALDREIESLGDRPISGAIQTDAPINPGNSGGPLLDKSGRLIGVNTSIASPSGGNVGIGFAIPVDTVNAIVPEIIRTGKILRSDAGIKLVDQRILLRNGIRNGVMVGEVVPDGPADKAGLKGLVRRRDGSIAAGDLITALDGAKVTKPSPKRSPATRSSSPSKKTAHRGTSKSHCGESDPFYPRQAALKSRHISINNQTRNTRSRA
jgi:S1-C subfamily serine protease